MLIKKILNKLLHTKKEVMVTKHPNEDFIYCSNETKSLYMSYNIKNIMGAIAEERIQKLNLNSSSLEKPEYVDLTSKLSTQDDLESEWCRYWVQQLKTPFVYQRKTWEISFVLQTLFNHNKMDKKGIGFACGTELLPSYLISQGAAITAGDKPFDSEDVALAGWNKTEQYTESKDSLFHEKLVERNKFDDNFTLQFIDMNAIPKNIENEYDFCWSICAMEHLGSIDKGLEFLKNTVKLLKSGGISVHTTEYNYLSKDKTLDNWGSVFFQKKHFEKLKLDLEALGAELYPVDYTVGNGRFDTYIDMPPYPHQPIEHIDIALDSPPYCPHIKLFSDGFPITCIGLIIKKK